MSDEQRRTLNLGGMTSAQFLEVARKAGEAIHKAANALAFPVAKRQAAEMEQVRAEGRQLGLTDPQIAEVVDAWISWYQQTPYPTSPSRIRDALIARAMRDDWRPPNDDRQSPYETGVCPACEQPVEFGEITTGLNGYSVTMVGRWKCRTRGCRYGPPTRD